jgi:hypothetical protein
VTDWARRFWVRLESLLRGQENARRLKEEIEFHLEQQIRENLARECARKRRAMLHSNHLVILTR